ncbi:MAG: flagellar filament capping protein FliD [Deltaproteobacteria bacterium]|nr:flagellar filament capping protein FliD [Deltaproteobacteria bacterium]MCB9787803.1 flagellar filament capping protein FliD [Deltaproteobacteria bacterium]
MFNILGLASGVDSGAIIDALLAARRVPIDSLQNSRSQVQTKISKLGNVTSKLATLKTAMETLGSRNDILSLTANSSNADLVSASADSSAASASYAIEVTALARGEKNRSAVFDSRDAEVTAGTMSISVNGGTAVDVTIEEGDTLTQVADKITSASAGVDATIIHDGSGGYYLQVTQRGSGYTTANASDAVSLTETSTGASGQALGLTEISTAQNAAFTVDGLAVTSQTNKVTDAIRGVTLELFETGTITLDVSNDRAGTKENIKSFVDAYNDVIGMLRDELAVDEDTNRATSLASVSAVRGLRSDFVSIISGAVTGASGAYSSLAQLGIRTDGTGKLAINDGVLDAALDADPDAVADLFVQQDTGLAAALTKKIDLYTDTSTGLFTLQKKSFNSQIDRIDDQITTLEGRLEQMNTRLVAQYTALETATASIQSQGNALAGLLNF